MDGNLNVPLKVGIKKYQTENILTCHLYKIFKLATKSKEFYELLPVLNGQNTSRRTRSIGPGPTCFGKSDIRPLLKYGPEKHLWLK